MKTFNNLINENNIDIPEFIHPDLKTPRDPEGKFWKAIEAGNATSDRSSKRQYSKAIDLGKELYALLSQLDNDDAVVQARQYVSDAVKKLEKTSKDLMDEMSSTEVKLMKIYLFILSNFDNWARTKRWYTGSKVDVKSGYVPFKGNSKDPKVRYRILVTLSAPVSEPYARDISRSIRTASPLHTDYIAGIEWNKEKNKFQILLTGAPGYKR